MEEIGLMMGGAHGMHDADLAAAHKAQAHAG